MFYISLSPPPQGDWPWRGQPHDHPERGHRVRTHAAPARDRDGQHRGPHGLPEPDSGAHTDRVWKHLRQVEAPTQKRTPGFPNVGFFSPFPFFFDWAEHCRGPSSREKKNKSTSHSLAGQFTKVLHLQMNLKKGVQISPAISVAIPAVRGGPDNG